MKTFIISLLLTACFPTLSFGEASVSPFLYFMRNMHPSALEKIAVPAARTSMPVTVRFSRIPDESRIRDLESRGIVFRRLDGSLLHTEHIYLADIEPDAIETIAAEGDIVRIESTRRPFQCPTLDVSNPQVQASAVWNGYPGLGTIDGAGVIVANVDTGIDIFHPGFFKPDGGIFQWIDADGDGVFDNGSDAVDLNGNGIADQDESLCFFDALFSDPLDLMKRADGVYDVDIDWLYHDANGNGIRDYGPDAGFSETDYSFGELLFVVSDDNGNNRLDPGELLTALGTSKIVATFDKSGRHYRGENLFDSLGDTFNHGTGSTGIVLGQAPGRRLAGMAPGAEVISIDRTETDVEEGLLWAQALGADIMMYEFATRIGEFLDGSSNLEVMINELYDDGISQFTASGNLAGPQRKKHAFLEIQKGVTDTLRFTVPDMGITALYVSALWHDRYLSPTLTLVTPEGDTTPVSGDEKERPVGRYSVNSGDDISPKRTFRMDVLIVSESSIQGTFSLIMKNRRAIPIEIDVFIADNVTQWMNGAQFDNHLTDDGTVCAPGTAEKGITVGAYDPRGTRNTQGDINDFSSWGNTIDGRRAVDITAPGTLVYSLTSHDRAGGQPGGYIDFGGTSAALPHVAGCAALAVQAFPDYTPDDISRLLLNGALSDSFTGTTPNSVWGYGKLRIYDSFVNEGLNPAAVSRPEPVGFTLSNAFPNPFNASTTIHIANTTGDEITHDVSIYNVLGQKVFHTTVAIPPFSDIDYTWDAKKSDGTPLSSGLYLLSVSNRRLIRTRSMLLLK